MKKREGGFFHQNKGVVEVTWKFIYTLAQAFSWYMEYPWVRVLHKLLLGKFHEKMMVIFRLFLSSSASQLPRHQTLSC